MDFNEINTVGDLLEQQKENETVNEEYERMTSIVDIVFDEGPEFGLMLSKKVLKALTKLHIDTAKELLEEGNPNAAVNQTVVATQLGNAWKLIDDLDQV